MATPDHGTSNRYTNHGCRCGACCEAQRIKRRAYYVANKERAYEVYKRWATQNIEKVRKTKKEAERRRRAQGKSQIQQRRWRESHPEQWKIISRRAYTTRRARRASVSVGDPVLLGLWENILASDPCCFCGTTMQEIDHIVPIAMMGSHSWDNLTASCSRCNQRKLDRPLLTFLLENDGQVC